MSIDLWNNYLKEIKILIMSKLKVGDTMLNHATNKKYKVEEIDGNTIWFVSYSEEKVEDE